MQHVRIASRNYELKVWRFLLVAIAAAAVRVAVRVAVAVAATASVHFAVNKLGEVDDEVLVPARSKLEVEKRLVLDSFHVQLQQARSSQYVMALAQGEAEAGSARNGGEG